MKEIDIYFKNIICEVHDTAIIAVKNLYNINILEFNYTIDSGGKKHSEKGHSGSKRILRDDEISIVEEDFQKLEHFIKNSSEVVGGGFSRSRKLPTIMHIYEEDNIKTYIIFEILNKKKELRFKTMYKNKKHFYQQGS